MDPNNQNWENYPDYFCTEEHYDEDYNKCSPDWSRRVDCMESPFFEGYYFGSDVFFICKFTYQESEGQNANAFRCFRTAASESDPNPINDCLFLDIKQTGYSVVFWDQEYQCENPGQSIFVEDEGFLYCLDRGLEDIRGVLEGQAGCKWNCSGRGECLQNNTCFCMHLYEGEWCQFKRQSY